MTQETLPQDATLFQLTEALISKADHVFVLSLFTIKTRVTLRLFHNFRFISS